MTFLKGRIVVDTRGGQNFKNLNSKKSPPIPAFSGGNHKSIEPIMIPDGRYCCPYCQTFYNSKNSFRMHCEVIHGPEEYYKCRLCSAVIKSKAYFRKHISQKHFKGGQKLIQNYGIRVNKTSS
jgi:hypothetical protein